MISLKNIGDRTIGIAVAVGCYAFSLALCGFAVYAVAAVLQATAGETGNNFYFMHTSR